MKLFNILLMRMLQKRESFSKIKEAERALARKGYQSGKNADAKIFERELSD